MGIAAIRLVREEVDRGRRPAEALSHAIASITLDCLEAVEPAEAWKNDGHYLLGRTWHVVAAAEGGATTVLTSVEAEVARCVGDLVADPQGFDPAHYPRELGAAIEPYLVAVG